MKEDELSNVRHTEIKEREREPLRKYEIIKTIKE